MRNDLKITTGVAAALLLAGCGGRDRDDGWTARSDTAVCTDQNGVRVPDSNCNRRTGGSGVGSAFLWYYLARNAAIPPYGERARGGTFTRVPGRSYAYAPASTAMTRSQAISRGGFGASGRSFGSGRS
ncbi:hypothetical protein [Sphingomonas sp. VNH70]|uniref:hypothetical protein n=1 Tax=Sphingomonas silueang TaxID=3156617 RepID=UPI0032B59D27